MTAQLIQLTRGQAIIEIEGELFNVNGEGLNDGTWEVFPLMVYERGADKRWVLVQDRKKCRGIIEALRTCWPDNLEGWSKLVIAEDHYQYERPLILPVDILLRVGRDFPDQDEAAKVREALEGLDCPEAARVARCVLHLSAGSVSTVSQNVATAMQDYRDIILFAEYDRDDQRLYDFSKPFGD